MSLTAIGVGIIGTIGLLGIIMILVLLNIAQTLQAERQRHIRREEILRLAWFRQYGQFLRSRGGLEECACVEEGPCMAHYGMYHRWAMGATEAEEIAALLKD